MPNQHKQDNVNALLIILAFIAAVTLATVASMIKDKIGADAAQSTRQTQPEATSP